MGESRRKNHFIPEFLLNEFASRVKVRRKKEQHYIWVFEANREPFETRTSKICAPHNFYGPPDGGVETGLSKLESKYSRLIKEIVAGSDPQLYEDSLREFVWLQCIRTKYLRDEFARVVNIFLSELVGLSSSDKFKSHMDNKIEDKFDELIENNLSNLPTFQRELVRNSLRDPHARSLAIERTKLFITRERITEAFQQISSQIIEVGSVASSAAEGQVRALVEVLKSVKVPPTFRPYAWGTISSNDGNIILGDICGFTLTSTGETGPIIKFMDKWHEVYFPISKNIVLYACKHTHPPSLTVSEINQESISISHEKVFGASINLLEETQRKLIGSKSWIITIEEIQRLANEVIE